MKKLILGMTLLATLASTAMADVNVDIKLGKGKHICTAEGIDKNPSLVRANSLRLAKKLALESCADIEGSDFFCKLQECTEEQNSNNLRMNISFNIKKNGDNIDIDLTNAQAGYSCRTEAFRSRYTANAPTKLEAKILVRKVCMQDYHGMHCDDDIECIKLDNDESSNGVNISNDGINIDIRDVRSILGNFGL